MDKYQDYVHIYTHWCMHGFMLQVVGNMQIRAFGHADTKSSKATDIDKALLVKTVKEWAARSFMNWYLSKSHRWINGKRQEWTKTSLTAWARELQAWDAWVRTPLCEMSITCCKLQLFMDQVDMMSQECPGFSLHIRRSTDNSNMYRGGTFLEGTTP